MYKQQQQAGEIAAGADKASRSVSGEEEGRSDRRTPWPRRNAVGWTQAARTHVYWRVMAAGDRRRRPAAAAASDNPNRSMHATLRWNNACPSVKECVLERELCRWVGRADRASVRSPLPVGFGQFGFGGSGQLRVRAAARRTRRAKLLSIRALQANGFRNEGAKRCMRENFVLQKRELHRPSANTPNSWI